MPLQTPDQVAATPNGHGIKPFGYKVEFAANPTPGAFADPRAATWKQRLISLQDVTIAYGMEEQYAQFSTYDPTAIDQTNFDNPQDWLKEPKNGECVRITIDDGAGNKRLLFKGTIRSVHEVKQNSGVVWNARAVSEISRLDEVHFTALFNRLNDPLMPQPMFDGTGRVYSKKFTVREIIDQILQFKDPWGTVEYFKYDADPALHCIDWGDPSDPEGLGNSPRCGGFIPSQLAFENEPKGSAILQTLARAGAGYTFLYDPATDRIRIVELSRDYSKCGAQWKIDFPSTNADDVEHENAYASQYTLKSDKTEWTSIKSANVFRVLTGPIRFYSGHHIIPEMIASDDSKTFPGDTSTDQNKRSYSPDLAHYRFQMPTEIGIHDSRPYKHYYVGAPMFPDWNIFEDWWPAMFEVGDVLTPQDWRASDWTTDNENQKTGTPAPASYYGKVEFQPFCIGDQVARGEVHMGFQDNLRAFQAWNAPDVCPACAGSGLVGSIYSSNDNEPNITLVLKGPEGKQRLMPEVTNYRMKPSYFGMIPKLPFVLPDGTSVAATNPFGLVPFSVNPDDPSPSLFSSDPVVALTGGYPLPWKNTCPFCRGVGQWPINKIRNINPELFGGHNLLRPQNNSNASAEVPMDPDTAQVGPETWEAANNRIAMQEGPFLQMEVPVSTSKYVLPIWEKRDLPYSHKSGDSKDVETLDSLPWKIPETILGQVYQRPHGRMDFPHPLQLKHTFKQIPLVSGLCVKETSGTWGNMTTDEITAVKSIVPSTWICQVPTTTVQMGPAVNYTPDWRMGRILFNQPVFIPCHKDYAAIQTAKNGQGKLTTNGLLSTNSPARGYRTVDDRGLPTGFWRPPRIWLTYTYSRERYFSDVAAKPDGTAIPVVSFTHTGPDAVAHSYQARAIVADGCYGIEVRKMDPDSTPLNQEITFGNRVIQGVYVDNMTQVEVSEKDFWAMPVPPKPLSDWDVAPKLPDIPAAGGQPAIPGAPDPTQDPYMIYKRDTVHCQYVQGRILKWDRTTPGEALVEASGWSDADHFGSLARPKVYTWNLRDDRPRLMDMAVRRLESANDIQVHGSLELTGPTNTLTTGLGYVDYPSKAKAAVVRISYNFNEGLVTELELEREETRVGELPPTERERQNQVARDVVELRRTVDLQREFQAKLLAVPQEGSVSTGTYNSMTHQ